MRCRLTILGLLLGMLVAAPAAAAPRHNICADVGDSFALGVSSFGGLRDWAPAAKQQGADFRFIYVYILAGGMADPDNFKEWYVTPFIQAAADMDATPVLTFYQLLDLGRAAGYQGSEADVVKSALADPQVMHTYFTNFVWLLQVVDELGVPAVVHVEPDSWGFMMWAMGVEGNDDPTTVDVRVSSSGHADVAGFADNAAGLGQALVALREQHAPAARLGWHASNFRVGTRPEVVQSFYAEVGDWDVLVGEHPHVEPEGGSWWEPWDEARIQVNLSWLSAVTESAGLPLILWQMPLGVDYHLIDDPSDLSLLERFVEAGAVALLFEHNQGCVDAPDPDDIRACGPFGEVPPAGHPAGGTAGDMRDRAIAYSQAPLPWPDGSICFSGVETGEPEIERPGTAAAAADEGACGCRLIGRSGRPGPAWPWVLLAAALGRRRRAVN